jgi:type III secretion system low calcium response chaperone LcrH/SycD
MMSEKQITGNQSEGASEGKSVLTELFSQGGVTPKEAMGLTDGMVEGMYGQAYRLYNTGKYADAIQLFRLLIMLNPTDAKYTLGLAACMHMLKEYRNAIELYTMCAALDPVSPLPLYHLSDCYLQIKDKFSALVSLEMTVKRAGEKTEYKVLKDRAQLTIESLRKDLKALGVLK